jgi:3-hydroxyisobutyrate dehydrogenase
MEDGVTIAFIGLGNMGLPMASNLVKAGLDVKGYDAAQHARDAATAAGIPVAESLEAVVETAETIITMLPNGAIVREVVAGIGWHARAGALLIECSTIDIESARWMHGHAREHSLDSVDAPVSGGIAGAGAATLTFMCGGEPHGIEKARPILEKMGKRIVACGPAGSGQAAKICNNMILGVSMIAVCEAFNLADAMGLDRQAMFDVVSASSGSCWSINSYCPVPGVGPKSPADNGYKPGFAAALMLKDLRLSQEAAAASGTATPLGAHATRLYERFVNEGGAGRDFSAMIEALRAMGRENDQ